MDSLAVVGYSALAALRGMADHASCDGRRVAIWGLVCDMNHDAENPRNTPGISLVSEVSGVLG